MVDEMEVVKRNLSLVERGLPLDVPLSVLRTYPSFAKAEAKAYNQRPEAKAYKKAYYQRPEAKAYRKAYYQRKKAEKEIERHG